MKLLTIICMIMIIFTCGCSYPDSTNPLSPEIPKVVLYDSQPWKLKQPINGEVQEY